MFRSGKWPCIMLLYVYGTVATSLVTQSVPVIGDIAAHFGLSRVVSGWVISIPSLVTALVALPAGWVIDRIGDKKVLLVGSLCALIGNLGVFMTGDVTVLFASRLLEGIGYLALTVGAVAMIMRTTEGPRRAIALGLWSSHTAVGIGVTLIVVAPLAGHGEQWRWAFGGHAMIMAVLVLAAFLLPGKTEGFTARRLSDIREVVRHLPPYRVALASAASAFIQTGIMASLTVYFSHAFAISIPAAAGVGSLAEVFAACAGLSVGYLLRGGLAPRQLALIGGVLLLAGGVALYLPQTGFIGATVAICTFSLGIGAVNGLIWTLVPAASPAPALMGSTSGLVAQATYLGVLLGPPAIFATLHAEGWQTRVTMVAVAAILQLAPLPIWRRSGPGRDVGDPAAAARIRALNGS